MIPTLPAAAAGKVDDSDDAKPPARSARRSGWRPWAELLKRSFDIDLRCPRCDGRMKLKSFLTSRASLHRLLTTLGEPTHVQGRAPARGPPYFASTMVRRRFAQQSAQLGMFGG